VTDSPIAHSRLHDFLWERQYDKAHLHARSAIEAYLQLAEGEWLTGFGPVTRCGNDGLIWPRRDGGNSSQRRNA
jgi:hypothetical protein